MNFISSIFGSKNDNSGGLNAGTVLTFNKRKVSVLNKIGEGGFASVYKGKDLNNNNIFYAIKHCYCMSKEQIINIENEINTMQKIDKNDNIITFYGYNKKMINNNDNLMNNRTEYFILMEYMETNLIKYLQERIELNKKLTENELLYYYLQICKGLYFIHKLNIAHRDMKIDNILMNKIHNNSGKYILKICDFGSCVDGTPKIVDNLSHIKQETENIERFTTLAYRSPEMIDLYQRKELSYKVDIWALGCIFYLLTFFVHPFDDGNKMKILDAKYNIPDDNTYSKKITNIIKYCLRKDPKKRPTTEELIQHITNIMKGGKGTIKKSSKKGNSFIDKTKTALLSPSKNSDKRRKSAPMKKIQEHIPNNNNNNNNNNIANELRDIIPNNTVQHDDDGWDPFSNDDNKNNNNSNDNNNDFDDQDTTVVDNANFMSDDFANDFFGDAEPKIVMTNHNNNDTNKKANNKPNNSSNDNNDDEVVIEQSNFMSDDFAQDFFNDNNTDNNKPINSKLSPKKKANNVPKNNAKLFKPNGAKKQPNDIKKQQNNIKPKKVDNNNKPKSNNNQNGSNDGDTFVEVDGMKVKQKIIEHQKQVLKQIELDKQKQQQNNKKSNNTDNNDVNNISNGNHNKKSPKKIQGGLDYSSEIEQLVGMGFDDRDKNLAAIIRAKGKIQIAVNILLQE